MGKTSILSKKLNALAKSMGYLLKRQSDRDLPRTDFSKGVRKVNNEDELKAELKNFFKKSELVVAQEYFPTEFDWRIGIIDQRSEIDSSDIDDALIASSKNYTGIPPNIVYDARRDIQ